MTSHFKRFLTHLAVAYTYGGKHYHGFSEDFTVLSTEANGNVSRTTGLLCDTLTVTVETTDYELFGYDAICWRVTFANHTDTPSAHLSDLSALSMGYIGQEPVLTGIYGDGGVDGNGAYAPYEFPMSGKNAGPIHMEPELGRGTYNYFPYFHIKDKKGGLFIAMGWPIMWKADFIPATVEIDDGNTVPCTRIDMGQARFDAVLQPGESAVMPSITLLHHTEADPDNATNHWRHFFMDCIMRCVDGALFPPHMSGGTSWLYAEMRDATEENQIDAMNKYLENHIPIDYWWMDAGWYWKTPGVKLESWMETGTWLVDTDRFPTEFAAISEYGERHGVKTLLWFEPEMARLPEAETPAEGIPYKYHLLGSPLVDMGDPGFVEWCARRFSSILDKGKISLYRQDYGVNPAVIFTHPEINVEGRVGMMENRYARGYWALWDKLIQRYPDMMIDDCAAGGGRNDIDSMRRAVPLHKTDHDYSNQNDKQSMHQSLFAWLPYFGACLVGPDKCGEVNPYMIQSTYAPWVALCANVYAEGYDWDCLRRYTNLWREINPYYTADYYPLTAWSRGDKAWRGWEFYDLKTESGFIQLFRPAHAAEVHRAVRLKGLNPDAAYELWNRETDEKVTVSGCALLHEGFPVEMKPDGAVTVTFTRRI
ncbi:MAG: alpha-galactosidase [Clostridia bacterium]|nr:alpha-galactosidase [Clostridia bacterium]